MLFEDMIDLGDMSGTYQLPAGLLRGSFARETAPRWQEVHSQLLQIARRRAALDAEEARWLREAEAIQIWRPLGMVSMIDYMERTLGYAPRTGQHRLRVARELGALPQLSDALARGELSFSAVKELVRVATPKTERAWCDAARGKNIRQLEELCAGHCPGDLPDDPANPAARLGDVTFEEITGSVRALVRQARQRLDANHGRRMSDNEVLAALCALALENVPAKDDDENLGRATFQIGYTVCQVCKHAEQEGAGAMIPVTPSELDRALCDAQHIGDLEAAQPQRATQDIPPATRRLVRRRDKNRCQTPGCRSSIGLELHHIIARSSGGTHDPSNLTLRCSACHIAHHEGRLSIRGTAPNDLTTERFTTSAATMAPAPVGRYASTVLRTEALAAMRSAGWSPAIAREAVDGAIAELGSDVPIADLLRAALRRAPRSN